MQLSSLLGRLQIFFLDKKIISYFAFHANSLPTGEYF